MGPKKTAKDAEASSAKRAKVDAEAAAQVGERVGGWVERDTRVLRELMAGVLKDFGPMRTCWLRK